MLASHPSPPIDTQFLEPALQRVIKDIYRRLGAIQATAEAATVTTVVSAGAGAALETAELGILKGEAGLVLGLSKHSDLESIGADDHHDQAHEVLDTDDHSDAAVGLEVVITSPADGHVLMYDATNAIWVNHAEGGF